jgi:putative redox protein
MMAETRKVIARASAGIGKERYRVDISTGIHTLIADEPQQTGGADKGPTPYGLLLSALAACTLITLKMYCERKSWPLKRAEVVLRFERSAETSLIERTLSLYGELSGEQRSRLLEIAERTPVTLTLKSGVEIRTRLRAPASLDD